jgi:hypothetical protein
MKKLIIILSTLGLILSSSPVFSAAGFPWPMFIPANVGGERLQNKVKTENLDGCWAFNYTIISDWTTEFCLNKSTIEESEQYVYWIKGLDSYGNNSVGGYWPEENYYHVLIAGSLFWEYFTFDFLPSSSSAVEGCYYQVDPNDGSASNCFPMTGYRTTTKNAVKSAEKAENDTEQQKREEIAGSEKGKTPLTKEKINLLDGISALQKSIGITTHLPEPEKTE